MKYSHKIINNAEGDFKRLKLPEEISTVEYLLHDMEAFRSPIFLESIERVLQGESDFESTGGNICSLEIGRDVAKVTNHFVSEDMLEECIIETEELKKIIELWIEINKSLLQN
ncbi:hypothetical protein A6764_03015 [Brevibacillus sp. WF146]|uniref:hypothetical protein n=1 Tax=Brevibacillus sp. WF146 TaxID=319501 RepID=UPI0007EE1298|nr:hypothetical protein [Brevibacillus sp. WF146]UYZ13966.1 hypothetical protein A6764_03015 [Brevibacillus sp. WF146]